MFIRNFKTLRQLFIYFFFSEIAKNACDLDAIIIETFSYAALKIITKGKSRISAIL